MAYIDVTGKTEDEAITRALQQLGMDRDDVSVEVLARAKKGFLGIGTSPAKVRVTYELEEESVTSPAASGESTVSGESTASGGSVVSEESTASGESAASEGSTASGESAVSGESTESGEQTTSGKSKVSVRSRSAGERKKKPASPRRDERRPSGDVRKEDTPAVQPLNLGEEVDDEKAQAIRSFLLGLLEHMGCPAEVRVYLPEKGRYKVILEGANMGALIGHRGETLDAIQQLTSYSINRSSGGSRVRVQLDTEGYREKREKSLESLAKKVAGKVVRSRRSTTLEPMNAYERHVIHTALQDYPNVSTHSVGTDPNRRVVITYTTEKE